MASHMAGLVSLSFRNGVFTGELRLAGLIAPESTKSPFRTDMFISIQNSQLFRNRGNPEFIPAFFMIISVT